MRFTSMVKCDSSIETFFFHNFLRQIDHFLIGSFRFRENATDAETECKSSNGWLANEAFFLPDVGNWIDSGDESGDEIKHLMPKCMPCWQGLAKLFHCQKIIMPQDHKSGTLILWSNGFVGHVFKSRFTTIGCFFFCTRKEPPNFSPADLWGTANIKAKF